mmetsp:Transcript_414/g.377  ORF Transcript_414/g.377 Transcript_414/m.377 type:complete len:165 (+) Transcript_414:128-622(+)
MPIFRHINIDFSQGLNRYNKLRLKNFMNEKNPGREDLFENFSDEDNDITEEGEEIGLAYRKVKLQLLAQQIHYLLRFYMELATKKQVIKSIRINLNNTEISDDDGVFKTVLKALKFFLISISDLCRTVEKIEIVFLRSNRIDKNEAYVEEIKTFLEVLSSEQQI